MSDVEVAILGGGISGCLTACLLADQGVRVLIVEQRDALVAGASRWNDGKIHLGYTYTGRPSLATAARMQEGAAEFLPTLERVLEGRVSDDVFGDPVTYLVDRHSMVEAGVLWERARDVAGLLGASMARLPRLLAFTERASPGASAPLGSLLERIDPEQAMEETGQIDVVAAWRTTEVHVATQSIADAIENAVRERGIPVMRLRVSHVAEAGRGWRVWSEAEHGVDADVVINSTWENRWVIDQSVQTSRDPISIRYKLALFGRGARALRAMRPSTRILGGYGDVATYRNGDAYLSWYPAGLIGRSDDGVPPDLRTVDALEVTSKTLRGLGLPPTMLEEPGASWRVAGGYVVAHGHGDIDDPDSPLHERYRPSITEIRPGYLSVDTGKYTLGPLMAMRASAMARRHLELVRPRGWRLDASPSLPARPA